VNSNDAARAIGRALAMQSGLANIAGGPTHIYAHDIEVLPTGQEQAVDPSAGIELPAVFIRVKCQALVGSSTIGRAKIEIDVVSQADDSTAQEHAQREWAIRELMANQGALVLACQVIGHVRLLGKPCLVENDPEIEHRAFKTPFTYQAGIQGF
jgi:hypothetical protein